MPLPTSIHRWVMGARLPTLGAALVPVVVGTACAWHSSSGWFVYEGGTSAVVQVARTSWGRIDWYNALAAAVVALALQVATNYANDLSDGVRGTDDPSTRTGPARLVGSGLATASEVKTAMLAAFGVALAAGAVLVVRVGWELIIVGVASVAAGYFYTGGPRPYGYEGLGEVFVFVFFGLVATLGSTYVQTGRLPGLSWGAAVAVGLPATALLVVNNLRDIPGDTRSAKRTLAVRLGDARTRLLYTALMVGPFLILPFLSVFGDRPAAALAFLAVPMLVSPVTAVASGARGRDLIPVLVATGRAQMVFGALLAVGVVLSAP
jgi:1,4-dihydroxy-2-naphthoate octaprenyltransferase